MQEMWVSDQPSELKTHGPAKGRWAFRGWAPFLVSAATLWIALACAAAAPAIGQLTMPTATQNARQPWAVAHIAKPSTTPESVSKPESATATVIPPSAEPETPLPAVVPTATESLEPTEAGESQQITMEIVGEDPQSAPSQQVPVEPATGGKYILVSLSEQHLYAYENGQLIYSFVASTGMGNSTRVGTFQVLDKIPNAYGANWNIWMPNWMGIYWSGTLENGIHALPILPGGGRLWAGYLGTPISYGCVVLGVDESLQLYDWADVGTTVEIRW